MSARDSFGWQLAKRHERRAPQAAEVLEAEVDALRARLSERERYIEELEVRFGIAPRAEVVPLRRST